MASHLQNLQNVKRKGQRTMTPQESQVLQTFLTQLTQAHVGTKDPDAQAMIDTAVGRQPKLPTLLVQQALLLEQRVEAGEIAACSTAGAEEQRCRRGLESVLAIDARHATNTCHAAGASAGVGAHEHPASAGAAATAGHEREFRIGWLSRQAPRPRRLESLAVPFSFKVWRDCSDTMVAVAVVVVASWAGAGQPKTSRTSENITVNEYSDDPGLSGSLAPTTRTSVTRIAMTIRTTRTPSRIRRGRRLG